MQEILKYNSQSKVIEIAGTYPSIDTNWDTIRLSGKVILPKGRKPKRLILVSHYTVCSNAEAPSNCFSLEGMLVPLGYGLIIPDYLGYGVTSKQVICHGDVYTWHNRKLTRAGVYDDTIHMKTRACDSIIYRLTLNVNSDYYEEFSSAICDNSTYLFRGHTYTKTGVYYDSLVTVNSACDSVFCLKLTVNPTYRNVETVMRCDIEPYWYNGHWLTQTGEYMHRRLRHLQ